MSRIRGRGNKDTELVLAKLLRSHGITGWRRHYAVTGKPDFVFPKKKLAIFVDGCFWHGCKRHFRMPTSNLEYWKTKFAANRKRDRKVGKTLRGKGWIVLRFWEHDLVKNQRSVVKKIQAYLISITH